MRKHAFLAICAGLGLALTATESYAVFITEQVTLNVRDPNGQGAFPAPVDPLTDIRRLDTSGGSVFTNQTTGAIPFSVGSQVRTLTASLLGSAIDGENFTPLVDNRAATLGNDLIAITAILGSITAGPPIAEATFTAGRTYIVSLTPGTFDPRNPSTWGILGTFVELALATPDNVAPGNGQPLVFDAADVNTSSANTTASAQADGRFLFREDSSAAQNADPKGGDNWFTVTTNATGFPQVFEGFLSQSFQTIEFADINAVGVATAGGPLLSGAALDAVDLGIMNAVFNDMRVKSGLAADFGFATGFGGAGGVTDFNPRWPPPAGDGPTGDFRGELQTRNNFGATPTPEPGSLALLSLGMASLGAFRARQRRRRSDAQALDA